VTAILGISAFYHDSAAALVIDGDIVAAAQEERFTRIKNDHAFPSQAIAYCLREAGLPIEKLDYLAFYDKPYLKFGRLLETYLSYAPAGLSSFQQAVPLWLRHKLHLPRIIRKNLDGRSRAPLVFLEHHESHAASAFFPSPFEEAAILTLDGVGEWSTTTLGIGKGNKIQLLREVKFPHSLGLLYSAFTYYCGFKVNSGEYKLMGLAPYGRPIYKEAIYKHLLELKADGSFWMNMDYFNYCQGLTMTNERFHVLFGGRPRRSDEELKQRHMDVAASIQIVTEDAMLAMGRELHRLTGMTKLVMAGGVALNCVANGKLLRQGPFRDIWIQPAAGDAGGALGAALFVWYQLLQKPRPVTGQDAQKASLLGPRYDTDDIRKFLNEKGAVYQHFPDEGALLDHVAQQMAEEKVVGWLHGRMEFGPRALGARSIIGDSRSPRIQATMNLKIKFRESFRPFAPCVLREHVHEWFQMRPQEDSPYMLLVAPVLEQRRVPLSPEDQERMHNDPDLFRRVNVVRSQVPAITHVDYSARVQTVDERHGRFYRLMKRFHELTGCPVIVNTSFNLSWEPIIESPEQAYNTFLQSEMDVLVLEDCVLHKPHQPQGSQVRGKGVPLRERSPNAKSRFLIDPMLPEHDQPALSDSLLRQFAALWLLFCGWFAYVAYTRERLAAAVILAILGLAFGSVGLVRPKLIRPLFVLLTTLTSPIGRLVSRILLTILYYGCFSFFAVLFRLMGRDTLCRRKQPDRASFWTPRSGPADIPSYFRQS
jgi:carbamoyltransferase